MISGDGANGALHGPAGGARLYGASAPGAQQLPEPAGHRVAGQTVY